MTRLRHRRRRRLVKVALAVVLRRRCRWKLGSIGLFGTRDMQMQCAFRG